MSDAHAPHGTGSGGGGLAGGFIALAVIVLVILTGMNSLREKMDAAIPGNLEAAQQGRNPWEGYRPRYVQPLAGTGETHNLSCDSKEDPYFFIGEGVQSITLRTPPGSCESQWVVFPSWTKGVVPRLKGDIHVTYRIRTADGEEKEIGSNETPLMRANRDPTATPLAARYRTSEGGLDRQLVILEFR